MLALHSRTVPRGRWVATHAPGRARDLDPMQAVVLWADHAAPFSDPLQDLLDRFVVGLADAGHADAPDLVLGVDEEVDGQYRAV